MVGTATPGQLHTAAHIFARSLQNLGVQISVRKADTSGTPDVGYDFIRGRIPVDRIIAAEAEVNRVISQGLDIDYDNFDSIEAAKAKLPNLRFNEERLAEVSGIRVVRIGDFDSAACSKVHVGNTSDILAFAVLRVTYPSGETRVTFRAAEAAIERMLKTKAGILTIASAENFDIDSMGERYAALAESTRALEAQLASVAYASISNSKEPFMYVKADNINAFFRPLGEYTRRNPDRYFIVFNDKQLLGARGAECSVDLGALGARLVASGAFKGSVKPDAISGRVLRVDSVVEGVRAAAGSHG